MALFLGMSSLTQDYRCVLSPEFLISKAGHLASDVTSRFIRVSLKHIKKHKHLDEQIRIFLYLFFSNYKVKSLLSVKHCLASEADIQIPPKTFDLLILRNIITMAL